MSSVLAKNSKRFFPHRRTADSLSRYAQQLDYDCGRSVVAAACWCVGLTRREVARVSASVVPTATDGACPAAVESSLRHGGLAVCSGVMDVVDLAYHCNERGRVVLCPISDRGGHWVCVLGLVGQGGEGGDSRVRYWCPAGGGGVWTVPSEWYAERWRDSDRWGREWASWGVACWVG